MQQVEPPHVGNDEDLEKAWAEKAFKYADTFERLVVGIADHAKFRFTPNDDQLYQLFRQEFPSLETKVINIDDIKGQDAKIKWRAFLETHKGKVKDYNQGTLLRIDSQQCFGETNSTVVPRLQFYCIEIDRFKKGYNQTFRQMHGEEIKSRPQITKDEYHYDTGKLENKMAQQMQKQ